MIIDVKTFIARVEEIANEEPAYRAGGSGTDGTCDCIGLIIGAIRRAGGSWTGLHGSNYAARNEMKSLERIRSINDLQVGDVVYKAKEPGAEGYDLPDRYARSEDRRDYYHVGVVVSAMPLRIRHMTTPKPKMDTSIGKWTYHGWLKKISRAGEQANAGWDEGGSRVTETVYIAGGNVNAPINMRSGASSKREIIAQIPQGAKAELMEWGESWCRCRWEGRTGYVGTQFICREPSATAPASDANEETVTIARQKLEKLYDEIGDWLGLRG